MMLSAHIFARRRATCLAWTPKEDEWIAMSTSWVPLKTPLNLTSATGYTTANWCSIEPWSKKIQICFQGLQPPVTTVNEGLRAPWTNWLSRTWGLMQSPRSRVSSEEGLLVPQAGHFYDALGNKMNMTSGWGKMKETLVQYELHVTKHILGYFIMNFLAHMNYTMNVVPGFFP